MKLAATYTHHGGMELWDRRELFDWATDIFSAPKVKIQPGATHTIRNHVRSELESAGWAFDVSVDAEVRLKVFARKDDLAFQLQTGNISRYSYDVLKMQHLYLRKEIESAVLAVPNKEASRKLGQNIASAERIWGELLVFDRIITLPMMVIAFA